MRIYAKLPARLRSAIDEFQPDIVHSMYGGIMAALVTHTVTDRPTIITFHGSDLLGEHLSGTTRKLLAALGVRASHRAAKQANHVIVVSKNLRDALPEKLPRHRIHVIPCGIDLERFKPLDGAASRDRLGWNRGNFHVLFPANNGDPVKRPALARAAVDELGKLGVPAELHFLQGVPYDQVPTWFNASNLMLLTSRHEGSPTVVKEALACNVPVVSIHVGDVADRIRGVKGCFLAAPDPQDLAAKMLRVYHHAGKVAGRSRIQDCSLERIARRIKQVYEAALNDGTASGFAVHPSHRRADPVTWY